MKNEDEKQDRRSDEERRARTLENRIMSILTKMRLEESKSRTSLRGQTSFDERWDCACEIAEECRK